MLGSIFSRLMGKTPTVATEPASGGVPADTAAPVATKGGAPEQGNNGATLAREKASRKDPEMPKGRDVDMIDVPDKIPTYPSQAAQLPVITPEALIESQRQMMDRLQQASGLSYEDFETYIYPTVRNYADFVHLLPASEGHHHSGPGGLFRHGLEAALFAALRCEDAVFGLDHEPSIRVYLEPRWRVCGILGGLLHDIGKPLIDVGAIIPGSGAHWEPHATNLYTWLHNNHYTGYHIEWRPGTRGKRHESFTSAALYRIIPPKTMEWLARYRGQEAIDAMILGMTGDESPSNPLAAIIRGADNDSVSQNVKHSRKQLAASGLGSLRSTAAGIVRALNEAVTNGSVTFNEPGSAIWATTQGMFGIYPAFAKTVLDILRKSDEGDRIPQEPNFVVKVLADHGYLVTSMMPDGSSTNTVRVRIEATHPNGDKAMTRMHAVHFKPEAVLASALAPQVLARAILEDIDGNPITAEGFAAPEPAPEPAQAKAETPETPKPDTPKKQPETKAEVGADADDTPAPAATETKGEKKPEQEVPTKKADASAPVTKGGPMPPPDEDDKSISETDEPEPVKDDEGHPGQDSADNDEVIELRDRANERNPRDEAMDAAWIEVNGSWPPGSAEEAELWLQKRGEMGTKLIQIGARIRSGTLALGKEVFDRNEHIYFKYPKSFASIGMPPENFAEMLINEEWAEADPSNPTRTRMKIEVSGKKVTVIRISKKISEAFRPLLPQGEKAFQKIIGAQKAKPVVAKGPYIDADRAKRIRDFSLIDERDSEIVRLAFSEYITHNCGNARPTMGADDWRYHMREFARQHGNLSRVWFVKHLTRGSNVYLKIVPEHLDVDNARAIIASPEYIPATDPDVGQAP